MKTSALGILSGTILVAMGMSEAIVAAEAEVAELANTLRTNDLALVALINIPEKVDLREAIVVSKRTALINVWSLRPATYDDSGRERHLRRVETETMGAVARLLGLPPCPFPRCALSEWKTEAELDLKSRNLCPPCGDKAERIINLRGAALPAQ